MALDIHMPHWVIMLPMPQRSLFHHKPSCGTVQYMVVCWCIQWWCTVKTDCDRRCPGVTTSDFVSSSVEKHWKHHKNQSAHFNICRCEIPHIHRDVKHICTYEWTFLLPSPDGLNYSDVQAQLGLKVPAQAWPEVLQGLSPQKPSLSRGFQAEPGLHITSDMCSGNALHRWILSLIFWGIL
jgi:hypothetical protein